MTSKYTISNALAYVAITGTKKFLQIRTIIAIGPYVKFQCEDLNKPAYSLTDEGMELAKTSRLWKAHEFVTERGFVVSSNRPTPRHIGYELATDPDTWAFIGSKGHAYLPKEGSKRFNTELAATFKNG